MKTSSGRFITWWAGIDQARREILLATLFLLLLLSAGTLGYTFIEGWTWMDSLYMTFITLTTIGFAEVHPLTLTGRLFTIIIAIVGIGTVAVVAARSAQLLLIGDRLRQRQLMRKIKQLRDHYIVCGYGRIGRRIVDDLTHAGKPFMVIDRDEAITAALQAANIPALQGDAEDEDVLKEAGLRQAKGLIITLPEDSENVFITLIAREINPDVFILARTTDTKNRRKLLRAGAHKVVAPTDVGADRMAQVLLRPHVDRFIEQVLKTSTLGLQMDEVLVEPEAPLAGKTLAKSNFRQRFDAIVIAVIDGETKEMKFNPAPDAPISGGDILIVMGSEEMISQLRDRGCTP